MCTDENAEADCRLSWALSGSNPLSLSQWFQETLVLVPILLLP